MAENNDKIKAGVTYVVFICGYSLRRAKALKQPLMAWGEDPADGISIVEALDEYKRLEWPYLILGNTAYVYRPDDLSAEYSV